MICSRLIRDSVYSEKIGSRLVFGFHGSQPGGETGVRSPTKPQNPRLQPTMEPILFLLGRRVAGRPKGTDPHPAKPYRLVGWAICELSLKLEDAETPRSS